MQTVQEKRMRCPVDNETLVMSDRNGVEIDYCPKCRGVWLDRGELDKIIERAGGGDAPAARSAPAPQAAPPVYQPDPRMAPPMPPQGYGQRPYRHDDDDDDYRHGRKKKSILKDIFDF
jgi:Zn-finger nucleic acid-binding protein